MTEQQLKLLTFIRAFVAEHEFSPSFDEMLAHMGLASKAGIHRIVHALERQGKVTFIPGARRTIAPVNRALTPQDALLASRLSTAIMDTYGFDDGEGLFLCCSEKELRTCILAALTR